MHTCFTACDLSAGEWRCKARSHVSISLQALLHQSQLLLPEHAMQVPTRALYGSLSVLQGRTLSRGSCSCLRHGATAAAAAEADNTCHCRRGHRQPAPEEALSRQVAAATAPRLGAGPVPLVLCHTQSSKRPGTLLGASVWQYSHTAARYLSAKPLPLWACDQPLTLTVRARRSSAWQIVCTVTALAMSRLT